jgi:hypothetical protein
MIVEIILAALTVILALITWQYVKYKDFRHQLNQLPGPPPLLFLGNIREISQQGTGGYRCALQVEVEYSRV